MLSAFLFSSPSSKSLLWEQWFELKFIWFHLIFVPLRNDLSPARVFEGKINNPEQG